MSLDIHDLSKSYNGKAVLSGLSYTFDPGITCISGPSGCGKTTLLRIIAGLEQPDHGRIEICDGQKISLVFQEDRLFENLSALKNVMLAASPNTDRSGIESRLKGLGISDPYQKVGTFSGGMKRRTSVLRALIAPHDILLLDEPCTGLDDETRSIVLHAIREDAECGHIVICVTHELSDIEALNANVLTFSNEH